MYRYLALLSLSCCILLSAVAQEIISLPHNAYFNIRGGLQHSFKAISQSKQITIAFLGGSITHNPGWRNKVDTFLREAYPSTSFRFINAGIPSLGSLPHAFRVQQDVLDSGKIDLLFLETAVNDRVNGTDSITQVRALEGIVRHARKANPAMDIILMSFADPDKTKDYNNNHTPAEIINHEMIAAHYNLPSINLAKEVRDRMQQGEFNWEKDFKDLHPSPFGQELYFTAIRQLLHFSFVQAAAEAGHYYDPKKTMPKPLDAHAFERGQYYTIDHAQYDDRWVLNPDWTPTDSLHTRPGFVHRPMLVATTPGATLTLPFKGTAIGMAIVSGKDAGIVSYSIDNGPFKQVDLFTTWSRSLHLPWYILFNGELKAGKHQLQLKIAAEKNSSSSGNACRIVYFLVNE